MAEEYKSKMEANLKRTKVTDIMSKFAITTKDNTNISELAHLIMRFKISGVPVVSQQQETIGIVTATDLFNKMKEIIETIDMGSDPASIYQTPIEDIMTRDVHHITADMSLYDVIKLMCADNIHTLPVVSGTEIIGIVGRRDVINACYSMVKKST